MTERDLNFLFKLAFCCIPFRYSNLSLAGLAFGNKIDAPVYISQESGVVGLNFHQSKEVLITDSMNGSSFGVSEPNSYSSPGCQSIV